MCQAHFLLTISQCVQHLLGPTYHTRSATLFVCWLVAVAPVLLLGLLLLLLVLTRGAGDFDFTTGAGWVVKMTSSSYSLG
jgi:hypothetical protein